MSENLYGLTEGRHAYIENITPEIEIPNTSFRDLDPNKFVIWYGKPFPKSLAFEAREKQRSESQSKSKVPTPDGTNKIEENGTIMPEDEYWRLAELVGRLIKKNVDGTMTYDRACVEVGSTSEVMREARRIYEKLRLEYQQRASLDVYLERKHGATPEEIRRDGFTDPDA